MEFADFTKPSEKKKLILAGALGLIAILFLWWTFIGFGSGTPTTTRPASATPQLTTVGQRTTRTPEMPKDAQVINIADLGPVPGVGSPPNVPEPKRNIFAFIEKPVVVQAVSTPTATPTPTPPILVASISPANVYAKTADFTLEVAGDKFTPEMRIFLESQELPTKFKGPQQMSATVAATNIANPGARQIMVKTPDGRIYSNVVGLSVAPPPTPNYSYVGIYETISRVGTALLQDKNNKDILSVQRGDLLGGRFRVTSISEKEIVFMDANLKIKHTLQMTEGERLPGAPVGRPTPRVDAEDDEP
jgi:hypothetical protein